MNSKNSILSALSNSEKWVSMAALSSAVLAVLAALAGMKSTAHGNLVTRELIQNGNQWNYFQAKGIKANLLQAKLDYFTAAKMAISELDTEKLKEYRAEQEAIVEKTKDQEASIDTHLKLGGLFTRSVTFLQIAIGIIAVSILIKRRTFWVVGLGLAGFGIYFGVLGLLS